MTDESEFNRENLTFVPRGQRPRIVIFSDFNDAYAPLADIARENWKAYCQRHGYALRFYREFHTDSSRPETYGDKGRFRLYYDLRGRAEVIMYLDIDSLFMNFEARIEDRLPEPLRFVWTYDDSGPLSGLWIARTDLVTEKHLRYAYAKAAIENNVRHGVVEPNGISDQDSMRSLMAIPPFDQTFGACVPALPFGHTYPENYSEGDWIITLPGRPLDERIALMKEYAAKCLTPKS